MVTTIFLSHAHFTANERHNTNCEHYAHLQRSYAHNF